MKHYLQIKYGISRAVDTYGYNRVSIHSPIGKFYTVGGGYDMVGTVLGDYLTKLLTDEQKQSCLENGLYGIGKYNDEYYIDGECGLKSMLAIAKHSGYEVTELYSYDKKGRAKDLIGFIVEREETV